MQLLSKVALYVLAAGLTIPAILGDFTTSCNSEYLDVDALFASCEDAAGEYLESYLDLEACIGNTGGQLVVAGGDYGGSCDADGCTLDGAATLCCNCDNGYGADIYSCVYLGTTINNRNGYLVC